MKFGEKLKQIIGVAAPTIGTALGGPLGGMAGSFVAKALGVTDQAGLDAVDTSNPQVLVALKQAELDFQKHLADNQVSLEQIAEQDRDSARNRQVSLRDDMPAVVFYVSSFIFIGLVGLIFFKGLPPMGQGQEIILSMIGTAGTVWIAAVTYFVGTTRQSVAKDATIAKIAQQP